MLAVVCYCRVVVYDSRAIGKVEVWLGRSGGHYEICWDGRVIECVGDHFAIRGEDKGVGTICVLGYGLIEF